MISKQVISASKLERLAITGSAKLAQFENFSPACKAYIVNNSSYSSYLFSYLIFWLLLSANSYLELAILPCWRFLINQPREVLDRLVMMVRGLADPLASMYCRLYMVHRMQKLGFCNSGTLILCSFIFRNKL